MKKQTGSSKYFIYRVFQSGDRILHPLPALLSPSKTNSGYTSTRRKRCASPANGGVTVLVRLLRDAEYATCNEIFDLYVQSTSFIMENLTRRAVSGIVILLWDLFLTFPVELRYVWMTRITIPKFGYIVNRYLVCILMLILINSESFARLFKVLLMLALIKMSSLRESCPTNGYGKLAPRFISFPANSDSLHPQ